MTTQCSPGLSCLSVLQTSSRGRRGGSLAGSLSEAKTPRKYGLHLSCKIFPILSEFILSGGKVKDDLLVSINLNDLLKLAVDDDVHGVGKRSGEF